MENEIEKIVEKYIRDQIKFSDSDAKTAKENIHEIIHEIYLKVVRSFERYINVVVVKVSGEIIETKVRIDNLEDFKRAVGGRCRPVPIGDYGLCFVNDDGLYLKLPVNELATRIYQLWGAKSFYDYIVGDVLYLGHPDEDGEYVDIPKKFIDLIKS